MFRGMLENLNARLSITTLSTLDQPVPKVSYFMIIRFQSLPWQLAYLCLLNYGMIKDEGLVGSKAKVARGKSAAQKHVIEILTFGRHFTMQSMTGS